MDRHLKKTYRRKRLRQGIRKKISGSAQKPRLSIFRSNTGIYAQLIDDTKGITLAAASSKNVDKTNPLKPIEEAVQVGKLLAQKAVENNISEVVFDRGGYLYHGRVKALAEGARQGGLKF